MNTMSHKRFDFTPSHACVVLKWEAFKNFNSSEKWNVHFNSTQQGLPASSWHVWNTRSAHLSPLCVFCSFGWKCGYCAAGKGACLQGKGIQLLSLSFFKFISYIWANFKRRYFKKGKAMLLMKIPGNEWDFRSASLITYKYAYIENDCGGN